MVWPINAPHRYRCYRIRWEASLIQGQQNPQLPGQSSTHLATGFPSTSWRQSAFSETLCTKKLLTFREEYNINQLSETGKNIGMMVLFL